MKRMIEIGLTIVMGMGLIALIGCDKSTDSEPGTLIGTWEAIEIKISMEGSGDLTITSQSDMFQHYIIEVKEDSTITYEQWIGTDKEAEGASYEVGAGTWSVDGSIFVLNLSGDTPLTIEGTYKLNKNTLVIKTNMPTEIDFGGAMVPIVVKEITMNRIIS